ncbi:MAG: hypothetical protein MJY85_01345 [Fibrobacter sp.]|nr:hypothetical protein [Fibrobacter sp.]
MRQIMNITSKAVSSLSIAHNDVLFAGLMIFTPVVFTAMIVASGSVLAAVAVSVAYTSVILGERLD